MNIKDFIWEKTFKPKDFYYKIIFHNFPKGYEDSGEYLNNIYMYYDYSSDLVKESLKTLEELKNNDFNFINMQNDILHFFARTLSYDYRCLFDFYKRTYINKDYQDLYRVWDDLNKDLLEGTHFNDNIDKCISLALLFITYNTNIMAIKDKYRYLDYKDTLFAISVFKALTIKYWINNKRDLEDLINTTKESILDDSFIDNCSLKGIDTTSQSFQLIDHTATLIFNHEFNQAKKKVIK